MASFSGNNGRIVLSTRFRSSKKTETWTKKTCRLTLPFSWLFWGHFMSLPGGKIWSVTKQISKAKRNATRFAWLPVFYQTVFGNNPRFSQFLTHCWIEALYWCDGRVSSTHLGIFHFCRISSKDGWMRFLDTVRCRTELKIEFLGSQHVAMISYLGCFPCF